MPNKTCEWDGCDEGAEYKMKFQEPFELVPYCQEHMREAMDRLEYTQIKEL